MADSLYLSLWFSDFEVENMFIRLLQVLREFPFSPRMPGITYLSLHPFSWNEATVIEQRFSPGVAPEEATALAATLSHEDHAYVFEMNWDLWTPPSENTEWVLRPNRAKVILRGDEIEEGESKTQGQLEVDFGLATPFLYGEPLLPPEVETRVRANVEALIEFTSRVDKASDASARLLWSESDENLAQKLIERLQK